MRRGLDAFTRRDRSTWLSLCDPDYETVPSDDWPEINPIRGAEAAWDFYVEADEGWDGSPYEYAELIDAGTDKVVAQQRREMRGKASGADVIYSYWVVVTFRNGKFLRVQWFAERAEALAAAGLQQ